MKKTRIPLGSPADPPMDPPVWTTARYPPLHDLTPLLKTLLQFGLHLPLPACPFRTWVATFTPRFSVFTRRQLFQRKKCRPHVPGRKRATPVYSRTALACFTRTALACFTRRELFKRKKCRPHGPGKERAMPVHTHSTGNNSVQKSGLRLRLRSASELPA